MVTNVEGEQTMTSATTNRADSGTGLSVDFFIEPAPIRRDLPSRKPRRPRVGAHMFGLGGLLDSVG